MLVASTAITPTVGKTECNETMSLDFCAFGTFGAESCEDVPRLEDEGDL